MTRLANFRRKPEVNRGAPGFKGGLQLFWGFCLMLGIPAQVALRDQNA